MALQYRVSDDEAEMWERMSSSPTTRPTLVGSYRYDSAGNKVYDSGDVVSALGDRLITPGSQVKQHFAKIKSQPSMLRRIFGSSRDYEEPNRIETRPQRGSVFGETGINKQFLSKAMDKAKKEVGGYQDPDEIESARSESMMRMESHRPPMFRYAKTDEAGPPQMLQPRMNFAAAGMGQQLPDYALQAAGLPAPPQGQMPAQDPASAGGISDAIVIEDSTGPDTPGVNREVFRPMLNPAFLRAQQQAQAGQQMGQRQIPGAVQDAIFKQGGSFDPESGEFSVRPPAAQKPPNLQPMLSAAKMAHEARMKMLPSDTAEPPFQDVGGEKTPNANYFRPRRIAMNQLEEQLNQITGGLEDVGQAFAPEQASPQQQAPAAPQEGLQLEVDKPSHEYKPPRDRWITEYMKRKKVPREVAVATYVSAYGS